MVIGISSLWFGIESFFLYLPGIIVFYPVSLLMLGRYSSSATCALRYGWLLGLFGSSLVLYWIIFPVHYIGGLPWVLAVPCVLFVGSYLGFFCGVFSLFSYIALGWNIWKRAFFLGLTWYLLEWVRSWLLTGFPWLPFVIGFSPYPFMLQGASIIGVYALSGLYICIFCLFFEGILFFIQKRSLQYVLPSSIALVLFISICCIGYIYLKSHLVEDTDGIVVGIVQGNDAQKTKWTNENKYQSIDKYIMLSKKLLESNKKCQTEDKSKCLDLLVWPETVLPFDICSKKEVFAQRKLHTFVNNSKMSLLFGAPGIETINDDTYYIFNRAYYYEPSNKETELSLNNCFLENIQWYEKERLVPFGEYIPPFLELPFLKSLLQKIGAFTPGVYIKPLTINSSFFDKKGAMVQEQIPMGILICYEVIFPDLARRKVIEGARILITISNDSWFGKTSAPKQHLRLAQMRAIELRRWIARATTSGISAFIDPYGRIVKETEIFVPTYLVGTVVPLTEHTVYFFIAPWLPYVFLVVFFIVLWHSRETFFLIFKKRDIHASIG